MTLKHRARLLVQNAGIDISRFPGDRREHRRVLLLRHHRVNRVLDVGANSGQYATELRRFAYGGEIVSFGPISELWHELDARAASDPSWTTVRCAIGAESGDVQINIAANAGASSSILGMLERHVTASPDAVHVGKEAVVQQRLYDGVPCVKDARTFLKVDVQGYELKVLEGATRLLNDMVVGVHLEVSFVPLYDGGPLYRAVFNFIEARGSTLNRSTAVFSDQSTGQLLQADATFFRS